MKKVLTSILWASFDGLKSLGEDIGMFLGLVLYVACFATACVLNGIVLVCLPAVALYGWYLVAMGSFPWHYGAVWMALGSAGYLFLAGLYIKFLKYLSDARIFP